ncbi:MAG: hypothetical protein JNG86_09235 [Verrucomicrobiaceae bacterium]|nr:hypothetical protein [Verrucomicrobiaceae bacterium]
MILAGLGVLLWLKAPVDESEAGTTPASRAEAQSPAAIQRPPAAVEAAPRLETARADGRRELHAYRLAVKGGVVTLDGSTRIAGDFHRRRGPVAWMPGMWCVRLLDAEGRVLAEETANAPDDVCLVGDPQNLGPDGKPRVTQFAGAAAEGMLQVRLPPHPEAKMLKVYRIAGLQRADWTSEPLGRLLAAIPLP